MFTNPDINYMAVFVAAIVYFIIGAIWYAPGVFGRHWGDHHGEGHSLPETKDASSKVIPYIGEFLLDLVIAYVLALAINVSDAIDYTGAIIVALWVWLGFIATTHFSPVIWGRKSVKSFSIHAGFMLIGLIAMAIVLMALS